MDSTSACGFTCQICGEFHSGPEMHWHTPENCLRRQLAAANERAGRLEREMVERGKDVVFYSELHDSAVEALAACDESPWRSMESAPKDGRVILVAGGPAFSRWSDVSWFEDGRWQSVEPGAHFTDGAITHWMPLPAAPEEKP